MIFYITKYDDDDDDDAVDSFFNIYINWCKVHTLTIPLYLFVI